MKRTNVVKSKFEEVERLREKLSLENLGKMLLLEMVILYGWLMIILIGGSILELLKWLMS